VAISIPAAGRQTRREVLAAVDEILDRLLAGGGGTAHGKAGGGSPQK
jgi:hypothetical protein